MVDIETSNLPAVAVTAAVGAIVLLFILLSNMIKKSENEEQNDVKPERNGDVKAKKAVPAPRKKASERPTKKDPKHAFTHQWLASTLRGHSALVLDMDFSINGKYLVSCADDRSFMLWSVKDLGQKEHKFVRGNVEYDHATRVRFSPDNKALVMNLYQNNMIRVVKMGKKEDGSPGHFETGLEFAPAHSAEIIYLGISCSGKFLMTASRDTALKIWSLRGEILAEIDTLQINNSFAATSPCGRFVAASGFTSNVRVWTVVFDKSGNFKEVARAFELKGHSAGVHSFAFSAGSARMATVSKDGTWKLWDTDIEYDKGQEPYLLTTGQHANTGHSLIALDPDGRAVAIATGCDVSVYDATTAQHVATFSGAHPGPVVSLAFNLSGRYLVTAGGRHMNVFHNVVGFQASITALEDKRRKVTSSAQRERLDAEIAAARTALAEIEAQTEAS